MFVLIGKQTLIPKNGAMKSCSYQTKTDNVIDLKAKNEFVVPNPDKKGDYYVNPCLSQLANKL